MWMMSPAIRTTSRRPRAATRAQARARSHRLAAATFLDFARLGATAFDMINRRISTLRRSRRRGVAAGGPGADSPALWGSTL
jgi:hypothetical protein